MARISQVVALFRCIRFDEVVVLQGAPFLGLAFSIGEINRAKLAPCLLFAAASSLLVAHVFALNDWADPAHAVNNRDSAPVLAGRENISRRLLLSFSLCLLAASLLLFLLISPRSFLLAAAVAVLGIFYSHPASNVKSVPIISSLLHFIGGFLHFLLGYAVFSAIDLRGILIGLFFALTFTAGHLNQEVRDFDLDQRIGARTNAVAFGKRANFFAGFVLFTVTYGYLLILAWLGVVPPVLGVLPVVAYPLHTFWSLRALRQGLTRESVMRLQAQYRLVYALIGVAMLVALFIPAAGPAGARQEPLRRNRLRLKDGGELVAIDPEKKQRQD
jgi:4-hydroxybenzoate polyprenyltransferase